MVIPCDLLMLTGSAVMSEAMLTGESAPILKASLPIDNPSTVLKPESGIATVNTKKSTATVMQRYVRNIHC